MRVLQHLKLRIRIRSTRKPTRTTEILVLYTRIPSCLIVLLTLVAIACAHLIAGTGCSMLTLHLAQTSDPYRELDVL